METDFSIPPDAPVPRDAIVHGIAAQVSAIDELVRLAHARLQVFDVNLKEGGWDTAARSEQLAQFLRREPRTRFDLIVHDTSWLEQRCPRLLRLLQLHSQAMTILRTGPEARHAMDPLVIVDGRHFLHRFHADHPRAAVAIEQPALAEPLQMRFAEIWATGQPGLNASVLGL